MKIELNNEVQKVRNSPKNISLYQFIVKVARRENDFKSSIIIERCHINKSTFSKMKCDEEYIPSKDTLLLIALGYKLNLDEAETLLNKGGYSLMTNRSRDILFRLAFSSRIYDLNKVNMILIENHLKKIGSVAS